jgi:hypothetical protein
MKKDIVWTTKDGKKIPVCDMTTAHINNAINMLKRNLDVMGDFPAYGGFSGDMAQYYAEQEMDDTLAKIRACRAWIKILERELGRRIKYDECAQACI